MVLIIPVGAAGYPVRGQEGQEGGPNVAPASYWPVPLAAGVAPQPLAQQPNRRARRKQRYHPATVSLLVILPQAVAAQAGMSPAPERQSSCKESVRPPFLRRSPKPPELPACCSLGARAPRGIWSRGAHVVGPRLVPSIRSRARHAIISVTLQPAGPPRHRATPACRVASAGSTRAAVNLLAALIVGPRRAAGGAGDSRRQSATVGDNFLSPTRRRERCISRRRWMARIA
jgi:hypothetical protein